MARSRSPSSDALALLALRAAVGPAVELRADANQRWGLKQAVEFGRAARLAGLAYVEVRGGGKGGREGRRNGVGYFVRCPRRLGMRCDVTQREHDVG